MSRLSSAEKLNGAVTFGYDSRNRLTSTTDAWGKTVGYTYDENGNRLTMTLAGAAYASYHYDVVDRLTTLTDSLSQNFTYNYDVVNRLTSRVAPNGVTTSFTYDGLDRLFELSHTKSPVTLSINQYGYNNANNLVSWLGSAGNRSFNYDNADRLTSVLKMGGNESYSYDAVGNRTASHLSTSYTYQSLNKLASTTTATYTYDNNGSQLSKVDASGMRSLAWDPEKRLKQVSLPGGLSATYKYDALGRRIQRTTSAGADERYVYDGEEVVADLDSSSVVTTSYLNGLGVDDHLRQTSSTTGVSYFLTDHLGTTAALTDASGNVVETLAYDSFGNNTGSTRTRYTYTGRERDDDTGLLYYRARFYDPELGRFISEDPIGFAGGDVNLYGYVWQNPLRFTDPSGLDGGWAPSDLADAIDTQLERLRRYLTGLDPDAVNANTVLNYAFNNYKGAADLLRVGRGFGNYYYGKPCTVPADELFEDIGRASGIALLLAGPAAGLSGHFRAAAGARAMPGPVAAEGSIAEGAGTAGGAGAAKPFAMGLDAELDSFARARGATTWKQFPDPGSWKSGVVDKLADPNTPVHFNLNGVDVWGGVQRASSGAGGATDWELLLIRQNPQFWDSLTFWKNGQVAPNPFIP